MKKILYTLLLSAITFVSMAQESAVNTKDAADMAYSEARYGDAIAIYESLLAGEGASLQLYYNLGNYMGNNYLSCIITAQNALNDYPYTKLREELSILILRARYGMAKESVQEKMIDRYRDTEDEYYSFKNEFPESKYMKEADKIYRDTQNALKNK